MNTDAIIKVATTSPARSVAGAIAGMVRQGNAPAVQAIGSKAIVQAIKAVAIARQYLYDDGLDLKCLSGFFDVEHDDGHAHRPTAMRFQLEPIDAGGEA